MLGEAGERAQEKGTEERSKQGLLSQVHPEPPPVKPNSGARPRESELGPEPAAGGAQSPCTYCGASGSEDPETTRRGRRPGGRPGEAGAAGAAGPGCTAEGKPPPWSWTRESRAQGEGQPGCAPGARGGKRAAALPGSRKRSSAVTFAPPARPRQPQRRRRTRPGSVYQLARARAPVVRGPAPRALPLAASPWPATHRAARSGVLGPCARAAANGDRGRSEGSQWEAAQRSWGGGSPSCPSLRAALCPSWEAAAAGRAEGRSRGRGPGACAPGADLRWLSALAGARKASPVSRPARWLLVQYRAMCVCIHAYVYANHPPITQDASA